MALTKVSTDGVKDDAITSGKIPANAVGTSELADNAVTASKTSGVQTTINNNLNNRVITGSNTANTLNAESGVQINDNGRMMVNGTYGAGMFNVTGESALGLDAKRQFLGINSDNDDMNIRATYYSGGAAGAAYPDIKFSTSDSERLRITAGGNVGIGVSSPTQKLAVDGNIILPDVGTVHFGVSDTSYVRGKDSSDGYIKLGTNGVDRLEINSSGNMRVPSGFIGNSLTDNFTFHGKTQPHYGFNLSASNGNPSGISGYYGLAFATNSQERFRIRQHGGVTFNGDTAEANALDDYEEGTFTPAFKATGSSNNANTSVQESRYIKIGGLVFVSFFIDMNAHGNSVDGYANITGLPFTSSGRHYPVTIGYYNSLLQNQTIFTGTVQPSSNLILLRHCTSACSSISGLDYSDAIGTSTEMIVSAVYSTV